MGCGGWQAGVDRQEEREEGWKGFLKTDHTPCKGGMHWRADSPKRRKKGGVGSPVLEELYTGAN